jgi:hypothetical protein
VGFGGSSRRLKYKLHDVMEIPRTLRVYSGFELLLYIWHLRLPYSCFPAWLQITHFGGCSSSSRIPVFEMMVGGSEPLVQLSPHLDREAPTTGPVVTALVFLAALILAVCRVSAKGNLTVQLQTLLPKVLV